MCISNQFDRVLLHRMPAYQQFIINNEWWLSFEPLYVHPILSHFRFNLIQSRARTFVCEWVWLRAQIKSFGTHAAPTTVVAIACNRVLFHFDCAHLELLIERIKMSAIENELANGDLMGTSNYYETKVTVFW